MYAPAPPRPGVVWAWASFETDRRLRVLERLFPILSDPSTAYAIWRQLSLRTPSKGNKFTTPGLPR